MADIEVQVNGDWRELADGTTVAGALAALGLPTKGVAVAVDGAVVRRTSWDTTALHPGAQVEVLTAVQGG